MKPFAYLLTALCSGTLLLTSCNRDNATDNPASAPEAAGHTAGMDHSTRHHARPASSSSMTGVMNEMMGKMHAVQPKGNADFDFAHHMLEHHRGAVAMADLELREGKDATLRQMAEQIKADQQREIAEMESIAGRLANAPVNYRLEDPNDPFAQQMKASMAVMMQGVPEETGNVDQDFAGQMIPHHQSAVDMAKAELAHGKDPRLKEMAQQMIAAQQKEIQQLQGWMAKNASQQ